MLFLSNFQIFRLKELNKLFRKRVFEIISIEDLFAEVKIFDSRFINQIENENVEKVFEKLRLVV